MTVETPVGEYSGSLVARIAAAAKTTENEVLTVFATYGLPLTYPPARPRSIRLHRLRVLGVRAGTKHDGPFDRTFEFETDFTALVASNLRGKTSIFEIITWCLRGSARDRLQADVRRWLSRVELDVTVAGQAIGFRLALDNGVLASGEVLSATRWESLTKTDASTLIYSEDENDFAAKVSTLMLDRLGLEPLMNAVTKGTQVGTQTHAWPSYYSAINLPSGPDKPLLGDQLMAGLPGRLLQVFLDLPAAAVLTRVKAARDVLRAEANRELEKKRQLAEQQEVDRVRAEAALATAQAKLDQLMKQAPGASLTELADTANSLAREVADADEEWDQLNRAYRAARRQRQVDEKALNDVKESEIARLLFHGLDPSACPRCEAPITKERRKEEREVHRCAVCTTEVAGETTSDEEVEDEAQARVDASRAAEEQARQELESAESTVSQLTTRLDEAQQELRTASATDTVRRRMAAELDVARWQGALEMVPPPRVGATIMTPIPIRVLTAAEKVFDQESKAAASALFAELNSEIVQLARRFGMTMLESVEINRAAHLKVIKGGGAQSPFGKQSPGEQVRLRIAVVIALLRVGARLGISTHPGLVLIDSPKAEEVQDFDAAIVFKELAALAADNRIQVLITTADHGLSKAVLPAECLVMADESMPLW